MGSIWETLDQYHEFVRSGGHAEDGLTSQNQEEKGGRWKGILKKNQAVYSTILKRGAEMGGN